jgi:hypothetical protein
VEKITAAGSIAAVLSRLYTPIEEQSLRILKDDLHGSPTEGIIAGIRCEFPDAMTGVIFH